MRCFLIVVATVWSVSFVAAQKMSETQEVLRNLEGEGATYKGQIILNNGAEHTGTITYNDRTGILTFKSDSKTGTYSARNLNGFSFYDPDTHKERTFFSMESETRDGGQLTSQFFEVIRQYKDFAMVTKVDPVAINKRTGVVEAAIGGDYSQTRVVVSSAMTVYFINENLSLRPYLEVSWKDVSHINKLFNWDWFAGQSTRVRIIDRDLPKEIMGDNYKKVDKYAREKELHWDDRDGLVALLDYYDTLVDN
ncbi:MAG TPA: hypothetical protein VFE50_24115 [Cyclobacteriaceae bacterium]|nr:hypothetical protein [Cyclobacteriaceae bacterium]